jgi:hypothetical protein
MRKIKFKEPKSLLEVQAWKRKVSREIEKLGLVEFHKRSEELGKALRDRIEKARLAKLSATKKETLYILSVPGMKESLLKAKKTPLKSYSKKRP